MRYNPALDGLRAIAIILVLFSHLLHWALPLAGWVGVDVFFVLSGYLITSILVRELQENGKISFGNFYARRALRLLPALALLAICELLLSCFDRNGTEIRKEMLGSLTYMENWNMIFGWWPVGYMGPTWSLSVEEQFYLFWPLALLFLPTRRPLIWLTAGVAAMTVAEIVFWHGGDSRTEHALQYSTGIRPVGLLIGAALAFLPIDRWRLPDITAPAMFLVIGFMVIIADRNSVAFLSAPLTVSLATATIIVCSIGGGVVIDALSWNPLRYIGKISYGLYLYHVPIFFYGEDHKIHLPFYSYGAILLALVFIVSILSYEFVEKPILGLKGRFQKAATAPQAEGLRAV